MTDNDNQSEDAMFNNGESDLDKIIREHGELIGGYKIGHTYTINGHSFYVGRLSPDDPLLYSDDEVTQ